MDDKKILPKWRNKTANEKFLFALQILICILGTIYVGLQIFNVWDLEFNVLMPLMGINLVLLFLQYRKYEKFTSFLCLVVAIFVFITMFMK